MKKNKDLPFIQINNDGSAQIILDEKSDKQGSFVDYSIKTGHFRNLVNEVDTEVLAKLSSKVLEDFEQDEEDRSDWLKNIEFGLDLLGLRLDSGDVPFEGACTAQHPLLMEAAVKFQAKASNELLPADGPVKTKILGSVTEEKEKQALRVQKHLNYQITEQMTEFYSDTEKLLLYVPLMGSGFKKTYYSTSLGRPVSEFVPADQFVVPNSASDLFRSQRYTHILYKTENELEADFEQGLYEKPEHLPPPSEPKITEVQKKTHELIGVKVGLGEGNSVYTLLEQHVDCYIEGLDEVSKGFKIASPYIITVEKDSGTILGIRRNWNEGDEKRIKRVPFTHYGFVPGFGFYCFGYMHLLGNLQIALTSSLRSLVDAGQFANLQGGFKLKGMRILDDGSPVIPGQFKDIEAVGMDIKKAIMPLPFKEPSQVLYQMLNFLDVKGQKFADSTEQVIADSTNYGPVGTTLALLDASTKFFSAVHKRLHNSLKQELKAIAKINAETLQEDCEYNLENETIKISRKDYSKHVSVVPVSDPNISSNAHRMAKSQALLQMAQQSPANHNMREVLKSVYLDMGYDNIDKILPPPEEAKPNDPLTDIALAVEGKPIKAFEGQDHASHIAVKKAFLNDPNSGGDPALQKPRGVLLANIQEHLMLSFIESTKAQQQMLNTDENTPPTIEEAATQVALINQQLAQQQLDKTNNDGGEAAIMLAQAELLDTQTQAKKEAFDEKATVADLELKKEKLDLELLKEINKAQQFDKKLLHDLQKIVNTKGIDVLVEGLKESNQQQHQQQTEQK